jgi:hypothetical protein
MANGGHGSRKRAGPQKALVVSSRRRCLPETWSVTVSALKIGEISGSF